MEVQGWLAHIAEEPRRCKYKLVYTKVFPFACLNDENYSYWADFIKGNNIRLSAAVRDKCKFDSIEKSITKETVRVGHNYCIRIEKLSI